MMALQFADRLRCAAESVEDYEKLHQVLVHGRAGGLDHEHVVTAHRVLDLDVDLPVREPAHAGVRQGDAELG